MWEFSEGWKLRAKYCLNFWSRYVIVDWREFARTYRWNAASGVSTGFAWLIREVTTLTLKTMLSVRDKARAAESFTWIWTVQLLSATGPIQHCAFPISPNDRHPTQTYQSVVLTTLTGIPPQNTRTEIRTNIASVLRVQYCMEKSETCDVVMLQVMYKYQRSQLSAMFRTLATRHNHKLYWYYGFRSWNVLCLSKIHTIYFYITFQIIKYNNRLLYCLSFRFVKQTIQKMSHNSPTPFPSPLYPITITQFPLNTQSPKRNDLFLFLLFHIFYTVPISSLNQSPFSPLNYPLFHQFR
jgi:hypothetical protein